MKKITLMMAAGILTLLAGCKGDKPPDADKDGFADASDCAPQDAQAWQMLSFVARDDDADGFRVNTAGQLCGGAALPGNRSTVLAGTAEVDCDDANATRWASRHYVAVDTDHDGFAVAGAGDLCTGAALPAGYVAVLPAAVDLDCDDASATRWASRHYDAVDADHDGFAVAGAGDLCTGAALPVGYVAVLPAAVDLDCNDADAANWHLHSYLSRDQDGDGYRVNTAGTLCGQAALPANLSVVAESAIRVDCADADATRWRVMSIYADVDGDGAGSGSAIPRCIGTAVPNGFALIGYDPLTTELPVSMRMVVASGDDEDIL